MASEPGEVLVPFPETQTQETDADLQRVCDPRVAALGPLRRLLRVAAAGAVQSATRDAICIPPSPFSNFFSNIILSVKLSLNNLFKRVNYLPTRLFSLLYCS